MSKTKSAKVLKGILFDRSDKSNKVPVKVEMINGAIYISPKGYGDACSKNGYGSPIIVEICDGELRVVAWTDINYEDPQEVIGMEGARESLRMENHNEKMASQDDD